MHQAVLSRIPLLEPTSDIWQAFCYLRSPWEMLSQCFVSDSHMQLRCGKLISQTYTHMRQKHILYVKMGRVGNKSLMKQNKHEYLVYIQSCKTRMRPVQQLEATITSKEHHEVQSFPRSVRCHPEHTIYHPEGTKIEEPAKVGPSWLVYWWDFLVFLIIP